MRSAPWAPEPRVLPPLVGIPLKDLFFSSGAGNVFAHRTAPSGLSSLPRAQIEGFTLALTRWYHNTEHTLNRHGMAAGTPVREEPAGAMPFSAFQAGSVCIVLSAESCLELAKLDAFRLLCILLGFGNLSDHA